MPSASPASTCPRSLPVTRLVSSATRSGRSPKIGAGSGTARSPSSAGDAGVVLLGQHLGRRHQRALVAALRRRRAAPSPPRRSCRCPTSPCSSRCIGWGPARSASISAIARRCAPGQRERQPLVEAPHQLAADDVADAERPRARAPACAARARAAPAAARRRRGGAGPRSFSAIVSGRWMPKQRGRRSTSPSRSPHVPGHRVGDAPVLAAPQRLLDELGDLPGVEGHLLALRVDRHDAAGPVADQVDDRVRHLERRRGSTSALPNSATCRPGASWRSRHGWLKNTTREPARLVADRGRHHRPAVAGLALRDRPHGDQDERLLARHEVAHPGLVGAVDPAPGVEGDEVEDRVDAELVQGVTPLVADALQPRRRPTRPARRSVMRRRGARASIGRCSVAIAGGWYGIGRRRRQRCGWSARSPALVGSSPDPVGLR